MYVYVRVVENPEETGEVLGEGIFENKWVVVVGSLDVLAGRSGMGELVAEIRRFADEEVSVDSEEVVLDLKLNKSEG